jgi:chromosome segregation ATPase
VIAAPSPPPTAKRAPTPPTEKQLLALRERESDLRELLRHEEDRVRRQATQIAELNADVARLRERTWSQDAELTELRLSLGPLRASADRGAACEVALAALRAEMQVLLSEARSSVVHARSQGAAAALSRCRQLAAAPLSTLRQLAGLVAEDAAQSMGACVDQLVIAMQDPEGSANELRD